MEEYLNIGKRVPKGDARDKVTGRATYMDDLKVPGMLNGKILFSKFPHAKIHRIDTSKAEKLIGVRAVLTGRDIPPIRFGFLKDNVPLKWEKVRSYRDEVAAVAAIDPDIAEEALHLIEVEYEALPGVFDPEEAMREDAPLIHEVDAMGNPVESNVLQLPWKLVAGDVDKARNESDYIAEDS
ncbi:MAG: xanthine dehydrogenase family protein molybdopterin-binding subunit, partial [Proteobacteria bacterium]|nr:xanthine dehydrogenase family protein molybdopterin-binding subunit [Pseudomonadota bacterium]